MSLGDYLPEIQSGTVAINDMMAAVKKAQEDGVIDLGEKIQLLFIVNNSDYQWLQDYI